MSSSPQESNDPYSGHIVPLGAMVWIGVALVMLAVGGLSSANWNTWWQVMLSDPWRRHPRFSTVRQVQIAVFTLGAIGGYLIDSMPIGSKHDVLDRFASCGFILTMALYAASFHVMFFGRRFLPSAVLCALGILFNLYATSVGFLLEPKSLIGSVPLLLYGCAWTMLCTCVLVSYYFRDRLQEPKNLLDRFSSDRYDNVREYNHLPVTDYQTELRDSLRDLLMKARKNFDDRCYVERCSHSTRIEGCNYCETDAEKEKFVKMLCRYAEELFNVELKTLDLKSDS